MEVSRISDIAYLSGVIDEESDFSALLTLPFIQTIDFSGVSRVNSIGLRSWMLFMTKWGDKPLNYMNCTTEISDHLATIPALRGASKRVVAVLSAMIPYDCLKCNHMEDIMVKKAEVVPVTLPKVVSPKCRICSGEMELINPSVVAIFSA